MPGSNTHSTNYDDENHQQQTEEKTIGAKTTPPEQTDGGVSSYDEIIDNINKEIAKNEKQYNEDRKIDAVVAAINGIGDMGRALGNIYATTKYAPSAFDPSTAASGKYGAIAAKAKADHDKYRSAMLNYKFNTEKEKNNFNFAKVKAKAAEEQAKANQAYRDKQLDLYYQREERMQGQYELKANQLKWEQDIKNRTLDLREAELELKRMVAENKISNNQAKLELERLKIANKESGTTTNTTIERDIYGNEVGRTTTKTQNGGGKKTADLGSNRKTADL